MASEATGSMALKVVAVDARGKHTLLALCAVFFIAFPFHAWPNERAPAMGAWRLEGKGMLMWGRGVVCTCLPRSSAALVSMPMCRRVLCLTPVCGRSFLDLIFFFFLLLLRPTTPTTQVQCNARNVAPAMICLTQTHARACLPHVAATLLRCWWIGAPCWTARMPTFTLLKECDASASVCKHGSHRCYCICCIHAFGRRVQANPTTHGA